MNQSRVSTWVRSVFSEKEATDVPERALRTAEEALELAQACEVDAATLHRLVDYVMSRPVGKPAQEIAGTMVTLYALAGALGVDADAVFEVELKRIQQPEVIERCQRRQHEKRAALVAGPIMSPEVPAALKYDELKARLERAEVQLAGCGVAALGWSAEQQEVKPGDYGWSASYGDVLKIRRELEMLRAKTEIMPSALAALEAGIESAKKEPAVDRGSFAKYADDERYGIWITHKAWLTIDGGPDLIGTKDQLEAVVKLWRTEPWFDERLMYEPVPYTGNDPADEATVEEFLDRVEKTRSLADELGEFCDDGKTGALR